VTAAVRQLAGKASDGVVVEGEEEDEHDDVSEDEIEADAQTIRSSSMSGGYKED
jgi:hypothetical protein